MKPETVKNRGLPKFDTPGWLSAGTIFAFIMMAVNIWSLIARWGEPFLPFQLGKLLGAAVGLGLAIHCLDMIAYHRRNHTWGKIS
ncbi:MAG TPA: hypothetical protein VF318_06805 [Dehalococcoidales bacterium]|jgi:thiol:disulfide interchange protein